MPPREISFCSSVRVCAADARGSVAVLGPVRALPVRLITSGYLKVNTLVSELKSDALRERHWRMLFKKLRAEGRFLLHEMTLGHVWDLQLVRNEPAVKEVILVAQGEMALEEFLKQARRPRSGLARSNRHRAQFGADQRVRCERVSRRGHAPFSGSRNVADVRTGARSVPEQVPAHPRVGRALRQVRRARLVAVGDEVVALLQSL